MSSMLWIGTRKGLFALRADGARRSWKLAGPQFLGHIIHHVVQDPREPRTLLMAAKTGHLGPTVFRSGDRGRSWREAAQPPAFRKALEGEEARAVQRVFWLTPGHRNETGTWYAGSSPAGLFRSSDGGERWEPVAGFNDNPMRPKWAAFPTPDGEFLHSILVDPRDARHLYIAISIGGVFESTDAGASWTPLNEGIAADFLPDPNVPFGHDPHCVVQHPAKPDRLYQQNHCGIYRLDRRWAAVGLRFSDRGAPRGSRHRLGAADGRPDRVAAHLHRRQARRLRDPGRWRELAASRSGASALAGLVHGAAAGHVRGRARAGGPLFRHHGR